MSTRNHTFAVVMAACSMVATSGIAADYPERDMTLIVQSSPGGGSDIIARTIAGIVNDEKLSPTQMLVENKPGGGGAIAYNYVAQRKGDPYVMGTIATSFFVAPLMGQSPAKVEDFQPIAVIAGDPFILVAEAKSGIATLDDIRAKKVLRIGNTGPVTDPALLAVSLGDELDVEVRPVPFNGDGEVTTALLGGHIDLQFGNASEVMSQIEAGRVKAIAVTSPERLASLPDVPTFKELGSNIELMLYRGVVMPKHAPEEAISFWQGVMKKVSESETWKTQYVERNNSVPLFWNAEEFAARIPEISKLYADYLKTIEK
ncbi:Bug family tripartite tricarboxylate transporter substrate binding protein [Pseudaminobacter salicylatoxidans]|uniref:Bug family tripartite tricarboxylate transporter substrate binding protein n=1 Tax=Pseudaminobacter salicylatoxidans TaxID=93369 RepID=UPI00030A877D|nr:tripartite tricarboxylate transporter substrate binding protein [Pseudaminobacter salicylatoxidans]